VRVVRVVRVVRIVRVVRWVLRPAFRESVIAFGSSESKPE